MPPTPSWPAQWRFVLLSLADLQNQFAQAILSGDAPATLFTGGVTPAEALSVHRDTVMGALTNALRLSYPTVEALVGEAFFEQTCQIFAGRNLPRNASLTSYGKGFADFLADFAPAACLPYLPNVARLDRAIETVLRSALQQRRFALDGAVSIALPQSLAVLRLAYPADEIRAALGDDEALAAIVIQPAERLVLVWRKGSDAVVQRVSITAGRFIAALLDGESAEAAMGAAMATSPEAEAMQIIQAEIFAASFCTIISNPKETLP